MLEPCLVIAGLACTFHFARELARLGRAASAATAPAGPSARDASGRPLTLRVDRRQGGRRKTD